MTLTPKGIIDRTGVVSFGDASLIVCEDGPPERGWKASQAWEHVYRRTVFLRILQQLNRLGWTCTRPEISKHDVKQYGGNIARWSAEQKRFCIKGDLKADLEMSGRTITLKMFQNVNAPTRPDHDGRYESNKEACMPYMMRLEMERTRRRIRDYLCNVFAGYTSKPREYSRFERPLQRSALECIKQHYAESHHFDGTDWGTYRDSPGMTYNVRSSDGHRLEHGMAIWTTDNKGRWVRGTAMYNINNMWWVVLGRYSYTNQSAGEIFVQRPDYPRIKVNQRLRRTRLEALLSTAVKKMDFLRADVLKRLLWPADEKLYFIVKDDAYFRPNYSGYTTNPIDAGRYTKEELKPYASEIERGTLRAPLVSA